MVVSRILCMLIGYALGLFQTGYIYGKTQHIDIRQYGSGNAGTTNTLRTLGLKAGAITFTGDCGKAILAVFLAWLIFHQQYPDTIRLLELYAGLGAVLGHNYPFYMKFKGGKGIACTTGVIIAFHWQIAPLCIGIFCLIVLLTRYVSLGSILLVSVFFIQLIVMGQMGYLPLEATYLPEVYVLGGIMTFLAIYRHRANIKRLLSGTENKLQLRKNNHE